MLRELDFGALAEPGFITFIASIILLTDLIAGSYPAFYLSAFIPVKVFRAQSGGVRRGITVRNVLVVAQFSLAIALVVATAVNYRQLQFARNMDLGFNKDKVVVLWGCEGRSRAVPAQSDPATRVFSAGAVVG